MALQDFKELDKIQITEKQNLTEINAQQLGVL